MKKKAGRKKADVATEWEQKFVQAWLANGRNGTAAAVALGTPEKNAHVRACRTLARPRVVAYIGELVQDAIAKAEAERAGSVASLQECLEGLTAMARARMTDFITDDGEVNLPALAKAPAGLIRRYNRFVTTNEDGQVFERTNLELESAQGALKELLAYHVRALAAAENETPKDSLAMFADAMRGLAVLRQQEPGLMKAITRRWLSGEVIDVPARALPTNGAAPS